MENAGHHGPGEHWDEQIHHIFGAEYGCERTLIATFDHCLQKRCSITGRAFLAVVAKFGIADAGTPELDQQLVGVDGRIEIASITMSSREPK